MKKNYFLSALALGSMLLATSCSNDEPTGAQTGNGLTFTIQLPAEMGTRAFGDGSKAKDLYYAVYPAGANDHTAPLLTNFDTETKYHFTDVNTAITVTLDLVKNKEYNIFFYACDPDQQAFSYDTTNRQLEVDYSKMTVNSEAFDVFCKYYNYTSKGGSHTVELTRPLAQINIGTDDLDKAAAAGLTVTTTGLKIAEAYTTMDVTDNSMVGTGAVVTIPSAAIPTGETFPVGDYKYLTMGYVLVPSDKSISDVTLNVNGDVWNTYTSVPMQMNFRTNIYGSLLTNKEVFNVQIKPAFETPDYNIEPWDGSVEIPTLDAVTNTYTVSSAAQLAGISKMVSENPSLFNDKTIKLEADIDLGNQPWTPIGSDSDSNRFNGVFDGQGHTISNVNVNLAPSYSGAGLFGCVNGTVKNLTIRNISVSHISAFTSDTDNGIGAVAGSLYFYGSIENVHVIGAKLTGNIYMGGISGYTCGDVIDCSVDDVEIECVPNLMSNGLYANGDKAGGLIGYFAIGYGAPILKIIGNTVNNAKIKAYRDVGGLVGCYNTTTGVVKNNKVTNSQITCDQNTNWYEDEDYNIGQIIGRNLGGALLGENNNTYENVTLTTIQHE